MDPITGLLSGFGLSTSAGLNAYIPLLMIGLLHRFTGLLELTSPWDTLANGWVLAVLAVLAVIEFVADKIPVVDTVNDGIQTLVRPVAGAVAFAAATGTVTEVHPAVAIVLGLFTAGGVHTTKTTARPVITASTGGLGNPVVSLVEDVVSLAVALVAIVIPLLVVVALAVLAWVAWRLLAGHRRPARP